MSPITPDPRDVRVNRRAFLAGAAALSASAGLPRPAWAQAAPHSFRHGEFEVTVLSDGHLVLPAEIIAPDAPQEEVQALLASMGQGPEQVQAPTNAVLIRAGSDVVLIDTGAGSSFGETAGRLPDSLRAAGIDPGTITKVVYTHAHIDHIGGTISPGPAASYPQATHHLAAAEHAFWTDPGLLSRVPQEMQGLVTGAQSAITAIGDRLMLMKPGDEPVSGVRVLDTPGHTPGHISFEVAGDEGLIITGDAITNPIIFFAHPEWAFGFDADPALAVASRKSLLERAATDRVKLLGYHWAYPGVGYAERKDAAFRYVPVS